MSGQGTWHVTSPPPKTTDGLICQWAIHLHNPAWYTVKAKNVSLEGPYAPAVPTIGKLSFQALGSEMGQRASSQEARTEARWVQVQEPTPTIPWISGTAEAEVCTPRCGEWNSPAGPHGDSGSQ